MSEETQKCPVCGNERCGKGVSWVENFSVHSEEHPELKAERGMDNHRGW